MHICAQHSKKHLVDTRYYKSARNAPQVDYMAYMDEVANLVGCKPQIWKYLLSDPRFALRLFVGANAPYAYRLQGEGSWPGAKEALNSLPERVKKPLKNRACRMRRYKRRGNIDHICWYLSLKGVAISTVILVFVTTGALFSAPGGMFIAYSIYMFVFLAFLATLLLWYDKQYNFVTLF
ncbi:Dimethylaniline monooxygenase [N-oxide-forming] 5 [Toxocara canis]|uniref:Flavin-containing monooxygenase n=1 Tax=Toxocara canis TaxID=6265 RepID=A0A0B2VV59_TOXCA|nr:Dimethylaniline monooxygenase [N-oxide-forming] 5 [Toxocara canis]